MSAPRFAAGPSVETRARARYLAGLAAAVLAGLLSAHEAAAQVIRVAGTIADEGGRPVRGATIAAENPDQTPPRLTTTSNGKGQFGFIGVRRGVWTFIVEAPGFETLRFRHQVSAGRQEPLAARLSRSPAPPALPLDGISASDLQTRIARAESLASSGDLESAIVVWREILARVPALTSVHLQLGALHERRSEPVRALAAYRELLALEPENVRALAAVERLERRF
jgi:tetratricopeptide (TPR) repeat protein